MGQGGYGALFRRIFPIFLGAGVLGGRALSIGPAARKTILRFLPTRARGHRVAGNDGAIFIAMASNQFSPAGRLSRWSLYRMTRRMSASNRTR